MKQWPNLPPVVILMQKILKVKVQLKVEGFLFGLMDKQMESFHGPLILYMTTALRFLNAQRWKDS